MRRVYAKRSLSSSRASFRILFVEPLVGLGHLDEEGGRGKSLAMPFLESLQEGNDFPGTSRVHEAEREDPARGFDPRPDVLVSLVHARIVAAPGARA